MSAWSTFRESLGFGPSATVAAEEKSAQAGTMMESALRHGRESMMAALSLAAEDRNWIRVDGHAREDAGAHLTFGAIQAAAANSRALVTGNPIMRRAALAQVGYVHGDGARITGAGRTTTRPKNRRNVFDTTAVEQLEMAKIHDGNVLALLLDDGTIEIIPFYQIAGAIYNPRDSSDIWYFLRKWTVYETNFETGEQKGVEEKAFYRNMTLSTPRDVDWTIEYPEWDDVGDFPIAVPRQIDKIPIFTGGVVKHGAANRLTGGAWGVPDILAGIFYASEHKELLEAADSIFRAQSQYAVTYRGKTRKALEETAASLAGAPVVDPMTGKPAQYGQTVGMGTDVEMQLMTKIGAGIDFSHFDPIAGLASVSLGVPLDVVLGKEGVETSLPFSTKQTMKRHQRFWADFYRDIFEYFGKRGAKVFFPKIDPDPTHRQIQSIAGVAALKVSSRVEVRQLVIDTFGTDWDPEDVPDDDEWVGLQTTAPGSTEVQGGTITPGQGQTGQIGKLADGDHTLRDNGEQDHYTPKR